MTAKELLNLFKYYKSENTNPFKGKDNNSALWWEGEKAMYESFLLDNGYWQRLVELFDKGLSEGSLSGILTDENKPKGERIIIFFLDLWHGRHFPYDSYDMIFDY